MLISLAALFVSLLAASVVGNLSKKQREAISKQQTVDLMRAGLRFISGRPN